MPVGACGALTTGICPDCSAKFWSSGGDRGFTARSPWQVDDGEMQPIAKIGLAYSAVDLEV